MVGGVGKPCTVFRILGLSGVRKMSHLEPEYLWITMENPLFYGTLIAGVTRAYFSVRPISNLFGTLSKNEIPYGINAREAPNLTPCELSQHLGESGGTTGKRPAMVLG